MSLETLPPEILAYICNYIDPKSLSLVSKRIRAITLRYILRTLKVSFPGEKFDAILAFLKDSDNSQHVRTLTLDAQQSDQVAWQKLVDFLSHLTGLRSIECREDTALSLLKSWDQLPPCELSVIGFKFDKSLRGEDYELNPKFKLLTAPCLTSLDCCIGILDLERDINLLNEISNEDNEEDEWAEGPDLEPDQELIMALAESLQAAKVADFLTSVVPNLRRLDLRSSYGFGSNEVPNRPARKAKLKRLDVSSLQNPQTVLLERLQKIIDFEVLESLYLPNLSEITFDWFIKNPMSLPQLKELKFHKPRYAFPLSDGPDHDLRGAQNMLMSIPPLRKLELTGDYHFFLNQCLEHHSTLESLALHENPGVPYYVDISGISPKLLKSILQLNNLAFLDIEVCRSRFHDGGLRMLQKLRLRTLILRLHHTAPSFNSTSYERHRAVLEYVATDEFLARSIYDTCGLEHLTITSTPLVFHEFNNDCMTTVKAVLQELARSYEVTTVEGRTNVVELKGNRSPFRNEALQLDSEIMQVFRSIWPSKGEDWRDDWHSLPLFIDAQ
jgi:hypothetical protein